MRFMHDQTDVIALMLTFLTPAMIASVAVVSTACREAVNSMDALLDATVTLGEGIQPLVALGFDARRDEYLCSPLWKEVTERVRWPWVKVGKLVLQDIHREVIPGCDGEVDPRDLKDTIVWILGRLREVSQLVIRMQFPIHLDEQGCLPFKAQESVTKLSLVSDGAHSSINRWLRYLTRAGTAPLRALTHVNIITLGIRMCSVIRMEMPAPVNTFMFGGSSLREMELTHAILFAPICLESIHHPVSQLPHLAALRKLVLTSCVVYLRWMLSLPRLTELNMHSCTISAGTDTAAEGRSLVVREAQLHTSPLCMEQLVPHMHTSYLRIWPERVVEFNAHTWHALLHAQPPVLDIDTCKWGYRALDVVRVMFESLPTCCTHETLLVLRLTINETWVALAKKWVDLLVLMHQQVTSQLAQIFEVHFTMASRHTTAWWKVKRLLTSEGYGYRATKQHGCLHAVR